MADEHVTGAMLRALLDGKLAQEDAERLLEHVFSFCPRCLELAEEFAAVEGVAFERGRFGEGRRKTSDEYLATFEKAATQATEAEKELAQEKLRAEGLWSALAPHSPGRRLELVNRGKRYHTWGLFDRLLHESRAAAFRDPGEAVDLAYLALAVHEHLDPGKYLRELIADWHGEVLGVLGNAKRLAADFAGAAEAFVRARQALESGTDDPGELVTLISLEASLRGDLGHWTEAAGMLDRAIELCNESGNTPMLARLRLQQGTYVGWVDPKEGARLVFEAATLINPEAEPRLALCAQHNLAWFLNDAGKPDEALATLEYSRSLYRQFPDAWAQLRLRWLEGRINRTLGYVSEAEHTFRRCAERFLTQGLNFEYVLVSVDLAEVLAQQNRFVELVQLAHAIRDLLQAWHVHPEMIALWHLVGQQFRKRTIQERTEAKLFRDLEVYVRQHWSTPEKLPLRA